LLESVSCAHTNRREHPTYTALCFLSTDLRCQHRVNSRAKLGVLVERFHQPGRDCSSSLHHVQVGLAALTGGMAGYFVHLLHVSNRVSGDRLTHHIDAEVRRLKAVPQQRFSLREAHTMHRAVSPPPLARRERNAPGAAAGHPSVARHMRPCHRRPRPRNAQ
jgi:hypothetical protein